MNTMYDRTKSEAEFLLAMRRAITPGANTPRTKSEAPDIFAPSDDENVTERIGRRSQDERLKLVDTFTENAAPLNLGVHPVATFEAAAELIVELARSRQPEFDDRRQIIQHHHQDLHVLRLWERLAGESISVHTTFGEDPQVKEKTIASYIGITVADWGVAESATLVQLTRPGRPRSTSLVPSIHIALLREDRLLAGLDEVYALLRREERLPAMTFISGPSKTADIEAHMVHGAHGPREMHVIIVLEETEKQ